MARFTSGQLIRLNGDPGFVECEKVGDVTVVVGGVRTIVPSGDVGEKLVEDVDREKQLADLKAEKRLAEQKYDAVCRDMQRVIDGL